MAWRIHLANRAIRQLNLFPTKPTTIGVWTGRYRNTFYRMDNGAPVGERRIVPHSPQDRYGQGWWDFLESLKTSDDSCYISEVHLPDISIYRMWDGKVAYYRLDPLRELVAMKNGEEFTLELQDAEMMLSAGFDPRYGTLAVMDENARLHVFRHEHAIGHFDVGLSFWSEGRPSIAVSSDHIFLTDGQQLVVTDLRGQVTQKQLLHYEVQAIACSPNGDYLVTSDLEAGLIRLYDGNSLMMTHQRYAIDLLAHATQLQLLEDIPAPTVATYGLAVDNQGTIAFTMSGVICVSDASHMVELPSATTA